MLFNSVSYAVFFPVIAAIFYILPGRLRRWWLLAASFYFYMNWNPKYIFLMLFSIMTTYAGGRCLEWSEVRGLRGGIGRLL